MKWNQWMRQIHRWLSVVLTLGMLVNLVAVLRGRYSASLGVLALAPFFLLFLSGLYLFVLPYTNRRRPGQRLKP